MNLIEITYLQLSAAKGGLRLWFIKNKSRPVMSVFSHYNNLWTPDYSLGCLTKLSL